MRTLRSPRALFGLLAILASPVVARGQEADAPSRSPETAVPEAPPAGSVVDAPPEDEVTQPESSPHRRWTDGPRRVPVPHGAARDRAVRLGLGTREAAHEILRQGPRAAWRAAAGRPPGDLRWPVDIGALGRGFGFVRHDRPEVRHNGVDIATPRGMVIRAAADGIVAYSDNELRGYGNCVIVVHGNGWATLYAHADRTTVQPGWRVRRGERIGFVGSTGRSDGPHLHFELHVADGSAVNPLPHFEGEPWIEGRARLTALRRHGGGHTYGHLGEIEPDYGADAPSRAREAGTPSRGAPTREPPRVPERGPEVAAPERPRREPESPPRAEPEPPARREPDAPTRRAETAEGPRGESPTPERDGSPSAEVPADVARLLTTGPTRAERLALRELRTTALEPPIRLEVEPAFTEGRLHYDVPLATNVRAVQSGRVVYAGPGLRGDRTSVVVLHESGLVSLLTAGMDLTVAVGANVATGDRIGIVRTTAGVDLELLRRGRAIDPRSQFTPPPTVTAAPAETPAPTGPGTRCVEGGRRPDGRARC